MGLPAGNHSGVAGEVQPGDAGNAVKIPGLAPFGLHAVDVAVGFQVSQERPVERREVLIVGSPEVGERVVVFVENGVVGVQDIVGAEGAVLVHGQPEIRVGEERVGDAPDEGRIEFDVIFLQHGPELGHIQVGGDGVGAGEGVAVIGKMLPAGPGALVDGGEHGEGPPSIGFIGFIGLLLLIIEDLRGKARGRGPGRKAAPGGSGLCSAIRSNSVIK